MIALWIAAVVFGMAAAILASRRAVHHASTLAFGSRIPPFLIGVTLVAIGTDLPEIANSVVGALGGFGDLVVGDAIGSTITQMTLVLGLLPLIGGAFAVRRSRLVLPGALIIAALLAAAIFLADGTFTRLEGLVLVAMWPASSILVAVIGTPAAAPELPVEARRKSYHAIAALGSLAIVGGGATLAVFGFVELAELLGVPQYVIAFFGASLGTSLPELVVDATAILQKERDLAIGDIVGSSLIDATLSLGIGGLIAPLTIDAALAVRSIIGGVAAVAIVILLIAPGQRHTRVTGVLLLITYLAFYPLLLG